jgi:O-antigen/teichoic acid export membrane protein
VLTASFAGIALSREVGIAWNSAYVRKILQISAPLLIYGILTWIVSYIDRFIILGMLNDPAQVAIYDVAVKMVLFIDLIMAGLVSTVNPKVFSIWKDQNLTGSTQEVNRYYNGLTAFFLLVIPLFVLVAPLLIPMFIHNPVYYQAFPYLPLLSAGFAARVWFFMFLAPILFFKKTRVLPRVLLFSAVFEIGGGILLMHFFGLQGMVWTYFLVKPFQALFMFLESRRIYKFRVNRTKIFFLPVAFMMLVILSELFAREGTRLITQAAVVLASGLLVWFAYRREAMPILRKQLWG